MIGLLSFSSKHTLGGIIALTILVLFNLQLNAQTNYLDWNDQGIIINAPGTYNFPNQGDPNCPFQTEIIIDNSNVGPNFGVYMENNLAIPDTDADNVVLSVLGIQGNMLVDENITINFSQCLTGVNFGLSEIDLAEAVALRAIDCNGSIVHPVSVTPANTQGYLEYDPIANICSNCAGFVFPLTTADCAGVVNCIVPASPCSNNPYPGYTTLIGDGMDEDLNPYGAIIDFGSLQIASIELIFAYLDDDGAYDCPDNGATGDFSALDTNGSTPRGLENHKIHIGEIVYNNPPCTSTGMDWTDNGNSPNGSGVYNYTTGNPNCPFEIKLEVVNYVNVDSRFGTTIETNMGLPDSDADGVVLDVWGEINNQSKNDIYITFNQCQTGVKFGITEIDLSETVGIRGVDCNGAFVYPTAIISPGNPNYLIYDPISNSCTNCGGFVFPLTAANCTGVPDCVVPNSPCTNNPYMNMQTIVGGGINSNDLNATAIVDFGTQQITGIDIFYGYLQNDGAYDCPDASTNPNAISAINANGNVESNNIAHIQIGEIIFDNTPNCSLAQLDVDKSISSGPTLNANGTYDVTYSIQIENIGSDPLSNLQITDNLSNFAPVNNALVVITGGAVSLNTNYDGITDNSLLSGTNSLGVGQILTFDLLVNSGSYTTVPFGISNFVSVSGTDNAGNGVTGTDYYTPFFPAPVALPSVQVLKSVQGTPTLNPDGTYEVTYTIEIENTGSVALNNVQITDDLTAFAPVNFNSISITSGNITVNNNYDGLTDINLLAGTDVLMPGETASLLLKVNIGPYSTAPSATDNIAEVTGEDSSGNPATDSDPSSTNFTNPMPAIGIVKTIPSNATINADGTYDVIFNFAIENTGDQNLSNVQFTDNLLAFGPINSTNITVINGSISPNNAFDGSSGLNLLTGGDNLIPGETATLSLQVNLGPFNTPIVGINNRTDISAIDPSGTTVTNLSLVAPVFVAPSSSIEVTKAISSAPTLNTDGTYDVVFSLFLKNTGDQSLNNVQLTDDLSAFAPINTISTSVIGPLALNQNYDGVTDINLSAGLGLLLPNQNVTINMVVNMGPHNPNINGVDNIANVNSTDPSGTPVNDTDAAPLVFPVANSTIDLVKTVSSNPTFNADGTYDVVFSFEVENTGNQNLNNVQITDNLAAFGPINFANIIQATGNLSTNVNYDGLANINLLTGSDVLVPNETATLSIEINMGPHNPTISGLDNVADASATDPAGVTINASDGAIPIFPASNPGIEVVKTVSNNPNLNMDGTYNLTFNFIIKNTGDVDLNNVQLIDDLAPFAPVNSILYANESANLSPNANYDGVGNLNTLTGVDVLAPGETGTFELVLNVGPHNPSLTSIPNVAEVNAIAPNTVAVDNKDDVIPSFQAAIPALKIDKTLFNGPNLNADGTYNISFKIEAKNAGNVNLSNIQVIDDLSTYTPVNSININNFSANLSPSANFDGLTDTNTLLGNDAFAPGETGIFYIDVNVGPYSVTPSNLTNKAQVSGIGPSGNSVNDTDALPTPVTSPNVSLDVVKTLINAPVLNSDGTYDLAFKIDVENTGDVNLNNIQITDDLTAFLPVNSATIGNASANLSPNGLYNGLGDKNTLQGNDSFIPGQRGSFFINLNTGPYNNPPAVFSNVVNANANDPANQNITNSDNADVSFTTPLSSVKITKAILNGPTLNDDGTYDITFQINLENNGDVNLNNIQVTDDLNIFAPINAASIGNTSSNLSPNSNYNGISNVNALNGNDTFVPGETGRFDVSVNIGAYTTIPAGLSNTADVTGIDPNGISVMDNSSEPVVFPQLNPGISVSKQILTGPNLNNDGTYDLSFLINVENIGNVDLSNIQLEDNLSIYAPINNANISNTSANLSSNGAYNGIVITNTLIGSDVLSPGETGAFNVNVNFGPYAVTPSGLENKIISIGDDPSGIQFTDTATVPSPILSPTPSLSINKLILNQPSINTDGTYDVVYDIAIQNTGNVTLSNIQVIDDLSVFNPVNSAAIINTSANLSPNGLYNGLSNPNTLTGSDVLLPGQSESLEILMNIGPFSSVPPSIDNVASVSGNDPGGNNITISDATPTIIPIPGPQLTVIKELTDGPTLNNDGTYDISFAIEVENSGDLILDDIQVTDILTQYAPVNNVVVNNLSSNLSLNPNYNGVSVSNTLSGSDSFAPSETGSYEIIINVGPFDPIPQAGTLFNIINSSATDPSGNIITSDDQILTDIPNVTPSIFVQKTFIEDANPKADGTYDLTFFIEIENTGIVNLYDIQIIDDLSVYNPVNTVTTSNSTGNIALNSLYDGLSDVSLLTGNDVFSPGEAANFEVIMNVGPFDSMVDLSTLQNEVIVTSNDPNGNPINDDDVELTNLRDIFPGIDIQKNVTNGPNLKIDGTYDLTFSFNVTNNGNVNLKNIQVVDDLSQYNPINTSAITNTSANLSPNASFNGLGNTNLLLGLDDFSPGELGSFDVVLNVGPYPTLPTNGILVNEAFTSGTDPSGNIQMDSASVDSDFQNSTSTIDIVKTLLTIPTLKADGTIDLRFNINVRNSGNVNLNDVQIEDDLSVYSPVNNVSIINTSANISPNSAYNGLSNVNTLLGIDDFAPNETGSFDLLVNVGPFDPTPENVSNIADVKAFDPAGNLVQNSDDVPTTLPKQLPAIEVIKDLKGQPIVNSDGTYTLIYNIKVNNIGNADLNNIQLIDDLSPLIPVNNVSFSNTSANISSNSGYDGINDTNILFGSNTLFPSNNASIDLTVNCGPFNPAPASLRNLVEVISADPNNIQVSAKDSVEISLPSSSASIQVLKEIISWPNLLSDGTQETQYSITITNNGNIDLTDIQVVDDLNAFAPVNGVNLSNISANLSFNPAYNGTTNLNTLLGNNTLIPNETASLQISVNTGPYSFPVYGIINAAVASGKDPSLNTVNDVSEVSTDYDISRPELGLAKELTSGPVLLSDGTFTVTIRILVENSGNVDISNIQITDDLITTFSDPPTPNINGVLVINSSNNFNPNTAFDGQTVQDLLLGNDDLSVGEIGFVDVQINFGPMPPDDFTVFRNTANVTGIAPSGFEVEDNSHDGLDPDPEDDGPNDNDDPTLIPTKPPLGEIGIAKELTSISNILPDGTYDILYTLFIENSGPVNVTDIQIVDNLSTAFSGAAAVPINSVSLTNSSSNLSPSGTYNGITNTNVLLGNDDFSPGETGLIQIKVNVGIVPQPGGDFANQAFVSAVDSDGSPINDSSDDGSDPDKDDDGPLNDNQPTIVTLEPGLSSINITKTIISEPDLNLDGTYDVIYNLLVENTGYVPIENVQILDALVDFDPVNTLILSNVTSNLNTNPVYDGIINVSLLTGNDELAAGEKGSLNIVLNVGPFANGISQITNYTIASANDDSGIQLFDDDFADTQFEQSTPKIDVEKKLISGPTSKIDGTYDISFRIELKNTGDVIINSLQVIDNLADYAPINSINFFNISSNLSPNGSFNGIFDLNTLNGVDAFVPGEEGAFDLLLNIGPLNTIPDDLKNVALANGIDPAGNQVSDTDEIETPVEPFDPAVKIQKNLISNPVLNSDGTYNFTFLIQLSNEGNVILDNLQIIDELSNFAPINSASISNVSSNLSSNPAYNGITSTNLLSGTNSFEPDENGILNLTVNAGPYATIPNNLNNLAIVNATSPVGEIIKDEALAETEIGDLEPSVFVEKSIFTGPVLNADGTYKMNFLIKVENTGNVTLTNINLADDINNYAPVVSTNITLPSSNLSMNLNYDGLTNTNLLSGNDELEPGESGILNLEVVAGPYPVLPADSVNSVIASGVDPLGEIVSMQDSVATPFQSLGEAGLSVDKLLINAPQLQDDGTYNLTYFITAGNTGSINISNLQIEDDLTVFLPINSAFISTPTSNLSPNPTYDGINNTNTLTGDNLLSPGEVASFKIEINVGPYNPPIANIVNLAVVSGTEPTGELITDSDDEEAAFEIYRPSINADKLLIEPPVLNTDGTYDFMFFINLSNTGNVNLSNIQVLDDLANFQPVNNAFVISPSANLSPSPVFDGLANKNTLLGNDNLSPGETASFAITLNAGPFNPTPPNLINEITVSGNDPINNMVEESDAAVSLIEPVAPSISVHKTISSGPDYNTDGTYDILFTIETENTGDVILNEIQLVDGLQQLQPLNLVEIINNTPNLSNNFIYDGINNQNLLFGYDELNPNETGSIQLLINVGPYITIPTDLSNTVNVFGKAPNNITVTERHEIPVLLEPLEPTIGLAKKLDALPTLNEDGTYDLKFSFIVENTGSVLLNDLQITDDLNQFNPVNQAQVLFTSGNLSPNAFYDGSADIALLTGSDELQPNEKGTFTLSLNVGPYNILPQGLTNSATASATTPFNSTITDLSDDGDVTNNFEDDPTPTPFSVSNPKLEIVKALSTPPQIQSNGSYDLAYTITVQNTGNIVLNNLQLEDDLNAFSALNEVQISNSSLNININSNYNGLTDFNLLNGADKLNPLEVARLNLQLNVGPYPVDTIIHNQILASGISVDGTLTTDLSDDRTNTSSDDDTTPAEFIIETAEIGLAKTAKSIVPAAIEGEYLITYQFVLKNTGNFKVDQLNLKDDLTTSIGQAGSAYSLPLEQSPVLVASNATVNPQINSLFDGDVEDNLVVANTGALEPGESITIEFTVKVLAEISNNPIVNSASANARNINENLVEDISHQGTVPDPESDGAGNNSTPTTITLNTVDLVLEKNSNVVTSANIGDTVTYIINLWNESPMEATNIGVIDQMPQEVLLISSSPTVGAFNEFTNTWTIPSLAPNSINRLLLEVIIEQSGTINNYAAIEKFDQSDPDLTNNVSTTDFEVNEAFVEPSADLALTKLVNNANIFVGDETFFTIILSNNGPDNATNVLIEEILPTGLSLLNTEETNGDYDEANGNWTISSIESGISDSLVLQVQATEVGSFTNEAIIKSSDQTDPVFANNRDEAILFVEPIPEQPTADLSLNKTVSVNTILENSETAEFSILISNAGPNEATNIEVEEILPDGLSYISHTTTNGTYNPDNGIWEIPGLEAGGFEEILVEVSGDFSGNYTNTANISDSDQFDPVLTNNISQADLSVLEVSAPYAELSLTKTVSKNAIMQNERTTFIVLVSNAGPDEATNVLIKEILPQGLQYLSHTASAGGYNVARGNWQINSIPNNGTVSLTIDVLGITPGTITNKVGIVASDQLDPIVTNNTDEAIVFVAEVLEPYAELSLTKTVADNAIMQNETTSFTILLSNAGPDEATNVSIEEILPQGLEYINHSSTAGNYNITTGLWEMNSVPTGSSVSLTIEVEGKDGGTFTNQASIVASDQLDAVLTNNADEAIVFVAEVLEPYAELSLTKTVANNAIAQNDTTSFTILLSNAGPDAATNVSVKEILPEGLDYINNTATAGSYNITTGLWEIIAISSNSSVSLTLEVLGKEAGTITNQASIVASDQLDAVLTNNTDEAIVFVTEVLEPYAELSLTKTVADNAIMQNETTSFTILLSNAGPDAATNVVVEEILPQGLEYLSHSSTAGNYDITTGLWEMNSISSGSSVSLTIEVLGNEAGTITNKASLVAHDQLDAVLTNNTDEAIVFVAEVLEPYAELSLTKTVTDNTIIQNETTSFTVLVSNAGPDAATNIIVEDILPQGLDYISHSSTAGSYDATAGLWEINSLSSSSSVSLTIEVAGNDTGTFTNQASIIFSDQLDAILTNNVDEATVFVAEVSEPTADLSINKTVNVNSIIVHEENAVFTILVSNAGPDNASNIVVEELLPEGTSYISHSTNRGDYINSEWLIPDLEVGDQAELNIVVSGNQSGNYTNIVNISPGEQFDPVLTNNQSQADILVIETIVPYAELSLTKTVAKNAIMQNEATSFTILLSNAGPDDATNVVVEEILPQGLEYVGHSSNAGSYDITTGLWEMNSIQSGNSVSLTIEVLGEDAGTLTNQASIVASDQLDVVLTNNEDEAIVFVAEILEPYAELSLTKSVANNIIVQNETTSFSILISNAGPDAATNVVVEEILPQGLEYISHNTTNGSYNAETGLWEMNSIPAESSVSLTIEVLGEDVGTFTNQVSIVASEQLDAVLTNNMDEATVFVSETLEPYAELSLTKTVMDNSILQNENASFTILISNAGPDEATNVIVQEILPGGLQYLNHIATAGNYDITTGSWIINTIPVGSSVSLVIEMLSDLPGTFTNEASIISSDQSDGVLTNNIDEAIVFVSPLESEPVADLSISKTVNINSILMNEENAVFTILISNAGPDEATNIVVEESLPQGLSYISHITSNGSYAYSSGEWLIPNLEAGGFAELSIVTSGNQSGDHTNIVNILPGEQFDPVLTNNSSEANVLVEDLVTPYAELSLTKTANKNMVFTDELVDFTITIFNAGPADASNVTVEELFPTGLTLTEHTLSSGNYLAEDNLWNIPLIPASSSAQLILKTIASRSGLHINNASIISLDQLEENTLNNNDSASVLVEEIQIEERYADLSVSINPDTLNAQNTQSVPINTEVEYVITVTNEGPDEATNIVIEEILPSNLILMDHIRTDGNFSASDNVWNIPDLQVGESVELRIILMADEPGVYTNVINIASSDQIDEVQQNNTDLSTFEAYIEEPDPPVDLSLNKKVNKNEVDQNEEAEFTITLENLSSEEATNIIVEENLPSGLSYLNHSLNAGNYSTETQQWTLESLAAESTVELTIKVKAISEGTFTNEVKITAIDQLDANISNNKANVEIEVNEIVVLPEEVDLILTKTVDREVVLENENVEFAIILSNIGPDEATNIEVEEIFPAGLSYINHSATEGEFDINTGMWNISRLPVSSTANLTIEAQAKEAGEYKNFVNLFSVDQLDTDPNNNKAQANVEVIGLPKTNLSIQKSVVSDAIEPGETTEFVITLVNNGPDMAFNIEVDELWPNQLTYVAHSLSSGTYDHNSKAWNIDFLDVNESTNLTIVTRGIAPGNFRNAVSLVESTPADNDDNDNIAAVNLVVNALQTENACDEPVDCNKLKTCVSPSSTVSICPDFCVPGNFEIESAVAAINGTIETGNTCVKYTPYSGVNNAEDQILIEAVNEENVCVQTLVNIEINDCQNNNTHPNVLNNNQSYCAAPVQTVEICVEAEDAENDNLSICEINTHFDCTIGDINGLCFFYTPLPGVTGTRDVSIKICDDGFPELSTIGNYTVDVLCSDPNAIDDVLMIDHLQADLNNNAVTHFNGTAVFDPTLNDENISTCYPEFFIHSISKGAVNGTAMLVNSSIQYKPNEDFVGTDEIEYEICNTCGNCALATINIEANMCTSVYEVCAQPQIKNEVCIDFCDSNATIQTVISQLDSKIDNIQQSCFDYTPSANTQGMDTVEIAAINTAGNQETALSYILIEETCLNPKAENDAAQTQENQLKTISILSNDDPNTNTFFINIIEDANFGKVSKNLNSTVSYQPDYGFVGEDKFVYWLCNAYDLCSQAEVHISVDEDFRANIKAVADNLITNVNEAIRINVLANDTIAQNFEVEVVNSGIPQFGSNILFSNIITYKPPENFVGKDNFTYTICNNYGDCDMAEVNITILDNNEIINSTNELQLSSNLEVQSVFSHNYVIHLNILLSKNTVLQYEVISMLGKKLMNGKLKLQSGTNQVKLPYVHTANQIVLVRLYNKEGMISRKVFIE